MATTYSGPTILHPAATLPTTSSWMTAWMVRLLDSPAKVPLLIARVGLGAVMLPHGLQKTFGLFGGQGYSGTMSFFESQGVPAALAFLAIMAEFLGSLGLLTGLLTRVAAFGVLCNMVVAVLMVHAANGFFMNWTGAQAGEGFEYHILAIALGVISLVFGGGLYSVDRAIVHSSKE